MVAVGVNKKVANVIIINVVHQGVLAEVFKTLKHILISQAK